VNINMTLLGQMITFALFVWFTMRFVWPPMMQALCDREKKIADGLKAAAKSEENLQLSEKHANEKMREAKVKAVEIAENANKHADQIISEAKVQAHEEGDKLRNMAKVDIAQQEAKAKAALHSDVAALMLLGTQKILGKEIDEKAHAQLIADLIEAL